MSPLAYSKDGLLTRLYGELVGHVLGVPARKCRPFAFPHGCIRPTHLRTHTLETAGLLQRDSLGRFTLLSNPRSFFCTRLCRPTCIVVDVMMSHMVGEPSHPAQHNGVVRRIDTPLFLVFSSLKLYIPWPIGLQVPAQQSGK